jgi:lipopolysaccharide/colanic/teichoic acid biosynthesis glycosyltransferase
MTRPVRVLLVDDNAIDRDMLSRRLTRRGFEVLLATDGGEALERAQWEQPDLVLLDTSLPVLDGFTVTRQLKADPRITSIGGFLRRSSLDELPQFINVLKGQMSVVGPRPIVWDELERYGRQMDEVLAVRPGLTGLWQVSGRNNLSYDARVKLDVSYARRRTVLLDLAIILRTVGVILYPRDRGAY